MEITAHGFSHCGNHRDENQDSIAITDNIFALADGVGGKPHGRQAAELAVNTAVNLTGNKAKNGTITENSVSAIFQEVNLRILEELPGAGTTLSLLIATSNGIWCAHVGDSRTYYLNTQKCLQIGSDKNLSSQTGLSIHSNILTNHIGKVNFVSPTPVHLTTSHMDRFIICSDGLYKSIDLDLVMASISKKTSSCISDNLEKLALQKDPKDNYSAIVVRVTDS